MEARTNGEILIIGTNEEMVSGSLILNGQMLCVTKDGKPYIGSKNVRPNVTYVYLVEHRFGQQNLMIMVDKRSASRFSWSISPAFPKGKRGQTEKRNSDKKQINSKVVVSKQPKNPPVVKKLVGKRDKNPWCADVTPTDDDGTAIVTTRMSGDDAVLSLKVNGKPLEFFVTLYRSSDTAYVTFKKERPKIPFSDEDLSDVITTPSQKWLEKLVDNPSMYDEEINSTLSKLIHDISEAKRLFKVDGMTQQGDVSSPTGDVSTVSEDAQPCVTLLDIQAVVNKPDETTGLEKNCSSGQNLTGEACPVENVNPFDQFS